MALGVLLLIVAAFNLSSAAAAPARVADPALEELSVREWEALWTSVALDKRSQAAR